MSKIREILLLPVCIALCAVLFCVKFTGGAWHAVAGVLLAVVVIVHICLQAKKMKYKSSQIRTVDGVMMVAFALMVVTGLLMHPLGGVMAVKLLHKFSAVLFVLGMIGHIIQHKRRA